MNEETKNEVIKEITKQVSEDDHKNEHMGDLKLQEVPVIDNKVTIIPFRRRAGHHG